jgi:hypothetical protein
MVVQCDISQNFDQLRRQIHPKQPSHGFPNDLFWLLFEAGKNGRTCFKTIVPKNQRALDIYELGI